VAQAPVILVTSAHGWAGLAALVKGMPPCRSKGCRWCKPIGSERHAAWLLDSLRVSSLSLVGPFPEMRFLNLGPSPGLITAHSGNLSGRCSTPLPMYSSSSGSVEALFSCPGVPSRNAPAGEADTEPIRIGVAFDAAFTLLPGPFR
jgi:hypothetical protein